MVFVSSNKKQLETIPKMTSPTERENFIYLKKRTSKYCQNEKSGQIHVIHVKKNETEEVNQNFR